MDQHLLRVFAAVAEHRSFWRGHSMGTGGLRYGAGRHWTHRVPWNKGKLVGQKAPLKHREVWAIRIRLQLQQDARELALFNLAIDSRLRSCDLVRLRVRDICQGGRVASRAIVM
jgi:hypothetical protein